MALAYYGYFYWLMNRIQPHRGRVLMHSGAVIDYTQQSFLRMSVLDFSRIVEVVNVCSSYNEVSFCETLYFPYISK